MPSSDARSPSTRPRSSGRGPRRAAPGRRWMRSRTERIAAGVLLAAVLVAAFRHELGWASGGIENTVGAVPVEVTGLATTTDSRLMDSTRLVVRDPAALAAAWPALALGTPPPKVDFADGRAMVVIVATGQRTTGGHAIRVDSATVAGDTLRVHVTTTRPGAGCLTSQAFTAPAAAARIASSAATVTFVEEGREEGC